MSDLTPDDRALINDLQEDQPLISRPFSPLAKKLGLSEDALLRRINALKQAGYLTRFGPFFDVAPMGGAFCLCAMAVPAEKFEDIVTKVNAHPEVAHNYERTHRLNMWFVLATETPDGIAHVCTDIEGETGIKVLQFPKLKEFFIGFKVAA